MKKPEIQEIITNLLLIILSSLLFVFANPNCFIKIPLSFLGFFMYMPVLIIVHKVNFKTVWFYGGLYGIITYGLFVLWLRKYQIAFYLLVLGVYFVVMALMFLLLKVIDKLFKYNAWIIQWLLLCSFDYARTLGFSGMSFGVAAYTQWNFTYLIQIADTIGVFGLNAFILFVQSLLAGFCIKLINRHELNNKSYNDNSLYECNTHINYVSKINQELKKTSLTSNWIILVAWCLVFVSILFIGKIKIKDYSDCKTVRVAAVQHNEDSNEDGIYEYTKNINKLISLTDEAFEFDPEIQIVVWPETAVVPAVKLNYETPRDESRKKLITHVLSFIENKQALFLIGNAHIEEKDNHKVTYNSALLFTPGKNTMPPDPEIYSKQHLVPFNEYFPYEKYFPRLYKSLLEINGGYWEPGREQKVFSYEGLNFASPICFEDNFSDISRQFSKNGANCFFTLSNDSWSQKSYCQWQHLAIAKLRAVETRTPVVRCTTSGVTCYIDPNGIIQKQIPEFVEDYLICDVPVLEGNQTFYTKYGDYAGYLSAIAFALVLIIKLLTVIIKKSKE